MYMIKSPKVKHCCISNYVFDSRVLTKDTYESDNIKYYYNNDNVTEHQDFFNAYGKAAGPKGHEVSHENFTKFILDKGM